MELASVAGWFSRTTSSSLKNDLSWRPGSHTRVATSPAWMNKDLLKTFKGKKRRILEVASGAEVLQKCRGSA